MSGRGRGKQLTRPAWMHDLRQPPPSLPQHPCNSKPVDWVQAHAADGRPYWYSLSTGQTSWNDPTPIRPDLTKAKAPVADSPTTPSPDWKQHRTDDGRVYYYDATTRQTQWNAPSDFSSAPHPGESSTPSIPPVSEAAASVPDAKPAPVSHDALPKGWAEHLTDDGRKYYYHAVSRETRWQKPTLATPMPQQVLQNSGTKRASTSLGQTKDSVAHPSLPTDWAESRTPDGRIYYYNKLTRQTSWTAPSGQPDLKRPRITAPHDLRSIVDRARQQREQTSREPDNLSYVIKRPRSFEGKPLTDRQAESYFLGRLKTRDNSSDAGKSDLVQTPILSASKSSQGELGDGKFHEMLKERGIGERSRWLEVMSRCAGDHRYLLIKPYGRRKHAWMKFHQKLARARRRSDIVKRRKVAEQFQQLMNTTFAGEPHNIPSLNRCHPESVRLFEADARYKALDSRERPFLMKSFFSARVRRGVLQHAKRRKEALDNIRRALDARMHPSLFPSKEKNGSRERKENDIRTATRDGKAAERKAVKSPERLSHESMTQYFDDHTSAHDLEIFINNTSDSASIEKDDVAGLVRSWKCHLDELIHEKRSREREAKRAKERAHRAAFRNGVEGMILSGRLPINSRWKDVCERVAKESFARTETELGARPVDLFDDAIRLFDERVQRYREEFKRLLKDEGVTITDATTVEELGETGSLARFLKELGIPVASALLLDRQRKEGKRRQKEKDRAITEFEDLIRRCDIPLGSTFETAQEFFKDLPTYVELQNVVGGDGMRKAYDDFMGWRVAKEERRMKRKFGQHHDVPYNAAAIPAMETVKRARVPMTHREAIHFGQAQQQEEENGWAAAVSAKPLNESEKLEEREKRKREILGSLGSSHKAPALDADENEPM